MKLNKVAFAVASALAIAAGSAHAGQIQASATQIAKEVVANDAQALIAPAVTYAFAGDVNAQANAQGFQLQYILKSGTWAVASGNFITATEVLTPVAVTAGAATELLQVNYVDGANTSKTKFPGTTVVDAFVSADKTKLVFNVSIPQGAGPEFFMKNPRFTVNPPATNVKINGLASLLSALDCLPDSKDVKIEFKHALSNPGNATILNAGPNEGAEHLRGGAENEAVMLTFVENVKVSLTAAAATSRTTAFSLNKELADVDTGSAKTQGNYDLAALVLAGWTGATTPAVAANHSSHFLGKAKITLIGAGKDLDYSTTYGVATAGFSDTGAATTLGAIDLDTAAGKGANLKLTVPSAWPVGTVVTAYDAAGVAIAGMTYTTVAGDTAVSLSAITKAAADKLITDGAFVFADFPGTAGIPNTGNVPVTATLFKLAAANERNNMCIGNFAGIGGGIKIDVRNYASYATFGATGPATTVRMINNSENNAADVYGQMIYADGTYGAWGKLTDLKPREVANMSNKDIEALLVNAPAANNPFGAGTTYTSTAGTAIKPAAGSKAGIGDRLRLISTTGTTLRVQSYMVVGSTVIDTSNAQGVDFENGANDRAPTADAQPISQDAINGLSK